MKESIEREKSVCVCLCVCPRAHAQYTVVRQLFFLFFINILETFHTHGLFFTSSGSLFFFITKVSACVYSNKHIYLRIFKAPKTHFFHHPNSNLKVT